MSNIKLNIQFPPCEPIADMRSSELVDKDQKIFFVMDHIYLGTTWGSEDLALIQHYNITHIYNVAANHPNHFPEQLEYTNLPLFDHPAPDAVSSGLTDFRLSEGADFIHQSGINNKVILVHCSGGLSRSVSIIIAWLIKYKGLSLTSAVGVLCRARQRPILPNPSLWSALARLERTVLAAPSPSFDYTPWVVEDFCRIGLLEEDVRAALGACNMDADAAMNILIPDV